MFQIWKCCIVTTPTALFVCTICAASAHTQEMADGKLSFPVFCCLLQYELRPPGSHVFSLFFCVSISASCLHLFRLCTFIPLRHFSHSFHSSATHCSFCRPNDNRKRVQVLSVIERCCLSESAPPEIRISDRTTSILNLQHHRTTGLSNANQTARECTSGTTGTSA